MMRGGLMESVPLAPAPAWNQDVWDRVAALDLKPVVTQLVNRKSWSVERAISAERGYRRFLYLKVATPEAPGVPTDEVDEFWRQHILNTQQYASDCRQIGSFVHHRPSSGSDAEADRLQDMFFETWLRYETLFGEPYEETIGTALLQRWPARPDRRRF
jgi:hypothetical protein